MDLFPKEFRSDRPTTETEPSADTGGQPAKTERPRSKRGFLWRGTKLAFGGPVSALSLDQVAQNGRLIGSLVSDLKRGPVPAPTIPRQANGKLDRLATAYAYGLSEVELDERLALRRRQTARMAYLAFGLAWFFLAAWLLRLLSLDGTGQRMLTAVQFAPFCLVFFLAAFRQAHVNWQLRTGVLGSAGDYLRSAEPFFPRR